MKRDYLLGGNTSQGFFSYYEYLADGENFNKIYIIKGGPGTGKSTTMKAVGKWGENKGLSVDYIHCSSDPYSLDGVIIKEIGVAMVDGTSPHIVDVKNAGAVETILNMGDFWNENALRKNKKEIMKCNNEISAQFNEAYNYLGAAGYLKKNCSVVADKQKVLKSVLSIMENITQTKEGCGKVRKLFAEAITPEGIISYTDTLSCENKVVLKSDLYGGSEIMTQMLKTKLLEQGYDIELFYSPLSPEKEIRHIVVPEIDLSIITSDIMNIVDETGSMIIDIDDMIETKLFPSFLRSKLLIMTMIQQAVKSISGAKRLHDELESYYVPNIDFDAMEKKRNEVLSELEIFAQER